MNSTYINPEDFNTTDVLTNHKDLYNFYAMTEEEHKKAGHIKDSTGSWVEEGNYVDEYYKDW
jgi:hypothetical protein